MEENLYASPDSEEIVNPDEAHLRGSASIPVSADCRPGDLHAVPGGDHLAPESDLWVSPGCVARFA